MQVDLTQAANLRLANRDALEVRLAGRTAWKHPLADALRGQPGTALDFTKQQALRTFDGTKYVGPALQMPSGPTFTRASTAGQYPASGPYEMAGNNVPRHDYDPYTRAPLGYRAEPARTNLLTSSEFPNGVTDAPSRGNVTAVSDIEGGRTGLALDNSATNAWALKTGSVTAGTTYTLSADVEMEDGLPPVFGSSSRNSPSNTFTFYLENTPNGIDPLTFLVRRIGERTWRVSCTKVATTTIAGNCGVYQFAANQQRRIKVTGYQLETGAYPTSYIPTTASVVARAADRLYYTLPFNPSTSGLTMAFRVKSPAISEINGLAMWTLYDGVNVANRLIVYSIPSGIYMQGAGSLAMGTINTGAFAANADERFVMSISPAGAIKVSRNGGAVLPGALTGAFPSGMTRLDILSLAGSIPWVGTAYQCAAWQGTPFNDNDLRGLLAA